LYGVYLSDAGYAEIIDSTFGVTIAHGTEDVIVVEDAIVKMRNCNLTNTTPATDQDACYVYEEDADAVYGAQQITCGAGIITKDTGTTRPGGASSSAKMMPDGDCGANNPLTLHGDSWIDSTWKIWCREEVATTVTIYIRGESAWDGAYPTASQLYIEAKYLDHDSNATRTAVVSNDVIADGTTWVAFDVTFTPKQDGFVYINIYLTLYEAGEGIFVDIKPIVS